MAARRQSTARIPTAQSACRTRRPAETPGNRASQSRPFFHKQAGKAGPTARRVGDKAPRRGRRSAQRGSRCIHGRPPASSNASAARAIITLITTSHSHCYCRGTERDTRASGRSEADVPGATGCAFAAPHPSGKSLVHCGRRCCLRHLLRHQRHHLAPAGQLRQQVLADILDRRQPGHVRCLQRADHLHSGGPARRASPGPLPRQRQCRYG